MKSQYLSSSILTSSVLRPVHPVVNVFIVVFMRQMKTGARAGVCLAVVGHVELVLAVEDAFPLVGEVEPTESPRQARGLLLVEGSRSPVSSHPHSGRQNTEWKDGRPNSILNRVSPCRVQIHIRSGRRQIESKNHFVI